MVNLGSSVEFDDVRDVGNSGEEGVDRTARPTIRLDDGSLHVMEGNGEGNGQDQDWETNLDAAAVDAEHGTRRMGGDKEEETGGGRSSSLGDRLTRRLNRFRETRRLDRGTKRLDGDEGEGSTAVEGPNASFFERMRRDRDFVLESSKYVRMINGIIRENKGHEEDCDFSSLVEALENDSEDGFSLRAFKSALDRVIGDDKICLVLSSELGAKFAELDPRGFLKDLDRKFGGRGFRYHGGEYYSILASEAGIILFESEDSEVFDQVMDTIKTKYKRDEYDYAKAAEMAPGLLESETGLAMAKRDPEAFLVVLNQVLEDDRALDILKMDYGNGSIQEILIDGLSDNPEMLGRFLMGLEEEDYKGRKRSQTVYDRHNSCETRCWIRDFLKSEAGMRLAETNPQAYLKAFERLRINSKYPSVDYTGEYFGFNLRDGEDGDDDSPSVGDILMDRHRDVLKDHILSYPKDEKCNASGFILGSELGLELFQENPEVFFSRLFKDFGTGLVNRDIKGHYETGFVWTLMNAGIYNGEHYDGSLWAMSNADTVLNRDRESLDVDFGENGDDFWRFFVNSGDFLLRAYLLSKIGVGADYTHYFKNPGDNIFRSDRAYEFNFVGDDVELFDFNNVFDGENPSLKRVFVGEEEEKRIVASVGFVEGFLAIEEDEENQGFIVNEKMKFLDSALTDDFISGIEDPQAKMFWNDFKGLNYDARRNIFSRIKERVVRRSEDGGEYWDYENGVRLMDRYLR